MDATILNDCPQYLRDFLFYLETIKGRSSKTVSAYYTDLRTFFRFLKIHRKLVRSNAEFSNILIADVPLDLIQSVTLSDAYEFLNFTLEYRHNSAKTRSRKISALRTFFKYLTTKANLLEENPLLDLEVPSAQRSLPKYLSLEESIELLAHIEGKDEIRDYCIITLFLNCGMRLSELVGINLTDIKPDNTLKVTGKGNKERILYLNQACINALEAYQMVRPKMQGPDKNALFLSRNGRRISTRRVEQIVDGYLKKAGLGGKGYSTHKLRHTAATLMYQHGAVDIRLLQDILGHANLGTTEIYTHIADSQLEKAAQKNPLANISRKK